MRWLQRLTCNHAGHIAIDRDYKTEFCLLCKKVLREIPKEEARRISEEAGKKCLSTIAELNAKVAEVRKAPIWVRFRCDFTGGASEESGCGYGLSDSDH